MKMPLSYLRMRHVSGGQAVRQNPDSAGFFSPPSSKYLHLTSSTDSPYSNNGTQPMVNTRGHRLIGMQ